MFNKPFINLTAALIFATTAVASARVFTLPNQGIMDGGHKKPFVKAGIVANSGSIVAGTGYTVSHDATGEFTIDVPGGSFTSCPALVVSPAGVDSHTPIPNVYDYITCGGTGEVKIQVRIYSRNDGSLEDNSFHFIMVEAL